MRLATSLLLLAQLAGAASFTFRIAGENRGAWPEALSSLGLVEVREGGDVIVVPSGTTGNIANDGGILILEGDSTVAASFGFRATEKQTTIRSITDTRAEKLGIVWEDAVTGPRFEVPPGAVVYAREKWENAPVLAGMRHGSGALLWVATPLGAYGYSRYPYLAQALTDLGLELPFHSARLWAFFDSSYRTRVDLDYLAPKWRAAGIAALQVAAWHYWERDLERDAYLQRLIDTCHRNAIQVYAWVELPHVSERFWAEHPEWREKTVIGQDAQLDWRKLMNLTNRAAFAAVSEGLNDLAGRFDWDGINLAELYFESLEGAENPARFTPMNADVRAEFESKAGFDPVEVFSPDSPHFWKTKPASLGYLLNYRADLAHRQQAEWIAEIENIRKTKPWLDLVLTHVDDRLDTTMRDKIGADTSQTLPLLASHDFTFLIEDPATTWNLGPQRYPQIAGRYADATKRQDKLAIDINIVERYQDVYPTKQQTGLELFQLIHAASGAFSRVALYFENSIAPVDWALLGSSAAAVDRVENGDGKLTVESKRGVGITWTGPANVDGRPWPVRDTNKLWLPAGKHTVQAAVAEPTVRLTDLNADLRSATTLANGLEFVYQSSARALALLDHEPGRVEIDGEPATSVIDGKLLKLPRGQHIVTVTLSPSTRNAR